MLKRRGVPSRKLPEDGRGDLTSADGQSLDLDGGCRDERMFCGQLFTHVISSSSLNVVRRLDQQSGNALDVIGVARIDRSPDAVLCAAVE
jgi:hypothetical protein